MPMGEGSHRTMEKRIAVIGSGNVATHLATAVEGVVQICSPNLANATALAEKVGCDATNSPSGLADADIYIVAVKDDAIATVLESVPTRCRKALWMHTSGSVGKSVFDDLGYDRYGVFYPLQTFSKSVDLDMSRVPFFIEGSTSGPQTKSGSWRCRCRRRSTLPTVICANRCTSRRCLPAISRIICIRLPTTCCNATICRSL